MTTTTDPDELTVDLTAAVEAAARRVYGDLNGADGSPGWDKAALNVQRAMRAIVAPDVLAAAPHVQAATLRAAADLLKGMADQRAVNDLDGAAGIWEAASRLRFLADGFDLASGG